MIGRRALLRCLGGSLALSAIARSIDAESIAPPPKRLIIVTQNNGTQQANFWPLPGSFTSPILEPILKVPALAAKTTLVKGVFVPRDANGTDANEHDMGFARMWTGAPLLAIGGHPWGGAVSVDQIIARKFGVDPMTLAVWTSSLQPFPKVGFQHRRSFSYTAPGIHRLPAIDPFEVYARWFSSPGELNAESRRRLELRKSALDVASADLRDVESRLGSLERQKLDAHATSIRELETHLSDILAGRPTPGTSCGLKPAAPMDFRTMAPELLISDESMLPQIVTSFLDLQAAAVACTATRVSTLQLGYAGGQWRFRWAGLDEDHHALAHKDKSDEGIDSIVTQKIVTLNRWYASQIAYLAQKLDQIPEAGGTVLDHTLIVWSNEFGRGDHNQDNVPIVFIGGGLGRGIVVDQGKQTFQRVGTTVLGAMGMHVGGFGDAPSCGPLAGV